MIESSEDLRAAIREFGVLDADPGRVAEKILGELDDEEVRLVAALTLRDYVRHVLATPRPIMGQREFTTGSGKRTVSWKTAAIIDHVDAELRKSVFAAKGTWKHFGDCTEVDLISLVESRRKKARELTAEAERDELVLSALRDSRVETVREIPRDVLARVLAR